MTTERAVRCGFSEVAETRDVLHQYTMVSERDPRCMQIVFDHDIGQDITLRNSARQGLL